MAEDLKVGDVVALNSEMRPSGLKSQYMVVKFVENDEAVVMYINSLTQLIVEHRLPTAVLTKFG